MNSSLTACGKCLCGAVTVQAKNAGSHADACHCNMCRKWGGGPLLAVDCKQDVEFSGEEHIGIYKSSDWAERGFCSQCGTHLFYRLSQNSQYIIPVGLLDIESKLQFETQIFIEQKPSYYDFANDTKKMTGEEVFVQFTGG